MPKTTIKEINSRREQVYFCLLKGENAQQIMKTLNLTQATVYRDIRFLGKRSKKYVYEIAKGDYLALAYQRSTDGIGYVMSEAWRQFYDSNCPPKQKPYYLRLIKDCQESIIHQVTNGAAVLAVNGLRKRIEDVGIHVNVDNFNLDANVKRYKGDTTMTTRDTDKYDSTYNTIN